MDTTERENLKGDEWQGSNNEETNGGDKGNIRQEEFEDVDTKEKGEDVERTWEGKRQMRGMKSMRIVRKQPVKV